MSQQTITTRWRKWREQLRRNEREAADRLLHEEASRAVCLTDTTTTGGVQRVCITVCGVPLTQTLTTAAEMIATLAAQRALYIEAHRHEQRR